MKKTYYVYRLDDMKTGEFYFGSRGSIKTPEEDSYMGSPSIWKPNKKNLKKTILKTFENQTEAILYEREVILRHISDKKNMNFSIPHPNVTREGLISAIDELGKFVSVHSSDPLFGKRFVGITKGRVVVRDQSGKIFMTSVEDERYKNGELVHVAKGVMKGEKHPNFNKKWVNNGSIQKLVDISYSDPEWKEGTLQRGNREFSHSDTVWINKDGKNKRIEKTQLDHFLSINWTKGRQKMKKYAKRKKTL